MTLRPEALLRGLAVFFLAGALSGCNSDYLFVSDPVFDTLFPASGEVSSALSTIARDLNVSIDRAPSLTMEGPLGSQARELLVSLEPKEGAILSPLFFQEASALAGSFPDLDFLLLTEAGREAQLPENLLTLKFNRVEAFRTAGRVAADYLQEGDASVVLFALLVNDDDRQESRAFEAELPEGAISQRFVYSRAPERETIRQQIVSLGEGPYLWAIFLRGDTAFALDLVAPREDPLIAEDLGPGSGYSDFLLGSIERPYLEAMGLGVAALEESQINQTEITVSAVFQDANNDAINN